MRNVELDNLRVYGIIAVLIFHTMLFVFTDFILTHQATWGSTTLGSVDGFFIISGYVISSVLVNKMDDRRRLGTSVFNDIKRFYIRRASRILPLAWTVLALILLLTWIFEGNGHQVFAPLEANRVAGFSVFILTFNYYLSHGGYPYLDICPYWYMCMEEQFYILYPIFLGLTKNNTQRVILLVTILLLISFYIRPNMESTVNMRMFSVQARCDGLLYGCLIYFLTQGKWLSHLICKHEVSRLFSLVVILLMYISVVLIIGYGVSINLAVPLVCLLISIVVILGVYEKGYISVFNAINPVFAYLAKRTYILYLLNMPVLQLTKEILIYMQNYTGVFDRPIYVSTYLIIELLILISVTEILYCCVDQPIMLKVQGYLATSKEKLLLDDRVDTSLVKATD